MIVSSNTIAKVVQQQKKLIKTCDAECRFLARKKFKFLNLKNDEDKNRNG